MNTLARHPHLRIGPWDGIPSHRPPLPTSSLLSLLCFSLPLVVSCGTAAYVVPEGAEPPELVWSPPLAYPPALHEAGITGTVVLEGMVDTAGRVEPGSIEVIRSSRAEFEAPAIEMLSKSRFRPARNETGPMRMQVSLPIKFTLGRRRASRADSIAAAARVAAGERLAREGQIQGAMTEYAAAQELDPRLTSSAPFWYGLCWYGSVWGYAADVITACDQAVELADDRSVHDGRGIARILTGDFTGAIADLEVFIRWTTNDRDRQQRASWIEQLRAGRNPLTPEVLGVLRRR